MSRNNRGDIQRVLDMFLKPHDSQKRLDLATFVRLNTEYIEDQLAMIPCAPQTPKPDPAALIKSLNNDQFGWLGALTSRYIPGWPSQASPLKAFQFCLLVNNIKSHLTPFGQHLKLGPPQLLHSSIRVHVMSLIEALFPANYPLIRKTWIDYDFPPSVPDCSKSNSHFLIPQASSLEEAVQDHDMKMIYIKMCILSQVVDGRADKTWADRVLEATNHEFNDAKQKAINAFATIIVSLTLKGHCQPSQAKTIERKLAASVRHNGRYTMNSYDIEWLYRFLQVAVRSKDDWDRLVCEFLRIIEQEHFNNVMRWAKSSSDCKLRMVHQAYQENGLFPWEKVEHAYPGQLKTAREIYDLRQNEPFSFAYTGLHKVRNGFNDVAWISHMLLVAKGNTNLNNYRGFSRQNLKRNGQWNKIIQEFIKVDRVSAKMC